MGACAASSLSSETLGSGRGLSGVVRFVRYHTVSAGQMLVMEVPYLSVGSKAEYVRDKTWNSIS